jgi:hypothetical protein
MRADDCFKKRLLRRTQPDPLRKDEVPFVDCVLKKSLTLLFSRIDTEAYGLHPALCSAKTEIIFS